VGVDLDEKKVDMSGESLSVKQASLLKNNKVESSLFDFCQSHILEHEGGISNNENDIGGYTNKGITLKTFEIYAESDLGIKPTILNLEKLTNEQAGLIYKKHFWDPIQADKIHSKSIAYALYDFHVNAPSQGVKIMQESVNMFGGNLIVDNKIGIKTIKEINRINPKDLFDVYQSNRIQYYKNRVESDDGQKIFLKGWIGRVNSIKFMG
jgi:lysozyme family protein